MDAAVVPTAEGDQVLEVGGRSHPGKRQPWSRRTSAVRIDAGIVRVARPTESGTAGAPVIQADSPSADGATVTTVRTASQAIRRAVSGWIGPTPRNSAGGAMAPERSGPTPPVSMCTVPAPAMRPCTVSERSVSALTVTVRCGRCPWTSR
jgi:hypothetical protein